MGTVIAIDPGSIESGVAIYKGGQLRDLLMVGLFDLPDIFRAYPMALYVMEDVLANKFMYGRNQHRSKAAAGKMAQNVGMVKQAQRQIVVSMNAHGIEPVLVKPIKGNWGTISAKLGRQVLEERTGWTGKSNKDTRSAAFFGYLYRHKRIGQ